MIKDRHDVNRLIEVLENDPSIKEREDVERALQAQIRCNKISSSKLRAIKIKFDRLREISKEKCLSAPYLNPNLYDSKTEHAFAIELYEAGFKWTPRHYVDKYRLDFAFIRKRLDVEIDGMIFHAGPDQQKRDDIRDACLSKKGWSVLRFSGYDASFNPGECIQKIKDTLKPKKEKPK